MYSKQIPTNIDEENRLYAPYSPRDRDISEVDNDYDYATLHFKCLNKYHNSNATDGHGDHGDDSHGH